MSAKRLTDILSALARALAAADAGSDAAIIATAQTLFAAAPGDISARLAAVERVCAAEQPSKTPLGLTQKLTALLDLLAISRPAKIASHDILAVISRLCEAIARRPEMITTPPEELAQMVRPAKEPIVQPDHAQQGVEAIAANFRETVSDDESFHQARASLFARDDMNAKLEKDIVHLISGMPKKRLSSRKARIAALEQWWAGKQRAYFEHKRRLHVLERL